jgi:hypothetical protein
LRPSFVGNGQPKNVANLIKEHKDYRRVGEIAGKGGKQIERCVISTFQVAESMGEHKKVGA